MNCNYYKYDRIYYLCDRNNKQNNLSITNNTNDYGKERKRNSD